jgi:serine/threonine protein phosphatase PrpC
MSEKFKYIYNSKKGIKRSKNQDRVLIIKKKYFELYIVFDGVSSNSNSYIFIREYIKKIKKKITDYQESNFDLSAILYESNLEVINSGITGMSTIAVLFLDKRNDKVGYINVGDSRIYIFTNQYLEKITVDDSLDGSKNILTKCLGIETLSLNDFKIKDIDFHQNFLLCTDGFYNLMERNVKEYFRVFNFKNHANIKDRISMLQRRSNNDDSSYILLKNEI